MAVNPFVEWLAEVAAAPIVVQPDDINAEARANLWTFSLDAQQRAAVTPAEVEEFVRAVAGARARWLEEHGALPMWFYCWHDAQAGQLRLSLISATHRNLPFACAVERVPDLGVVVRKFLGPGAAPPFPVPVWVTELP